MKKIDGVLRESMKPQEGRTMEAGQKDFTKQYVVSNV